MRSARAVGSLAGAVLVLSAVAATPAWAGPSPQLRPLAAAAAAAALPAPVACNTSAGSCWQPPVVSRWQYQLQGSVNSAGQCIYPATGFINTAVTGASFATGQQVAPSVFDIDIYQDGKCYTPNNYGVLNTAAVSALHSLGDKVIGHRRGDSRDLAPRLPAVSEFQLKLQRLPVGKPVGGFRDEFWLNINTSVSGTNPNTGQTETAQQFILDELAAPHTKGPARLARMRSNSTTSTPTRTRPG